MDGGLRKIESIKVKTFYKTMNGQEVCLIYRESRECCAAFSVRAENAVLLLRVVKKTYRYYRAIVNDLRTVCIYFLSIGLVSCQSHSLGISVPFG